MGMKQHEITRMLLWLVIVLLLLIAAYGLYILIGKWNDSNKVETFAGQSGFKWGVVRSADDASKFMLSDITAKNNDNKSIPILISTASPNGTTYITPEPTNDVVNITIDSDTANLKLVNEVISLNTASVTDQYINFLSSSNSTQNYKFLEMPSIGNGFTFAMLVKFAGTRALGGIGKYESLLEIYNTSGVKFYIARNGSDFDTKTDSSSLNNRLAFGFAGIGIINSSQVITDTNWHHIAVTVNYVSTDTTKTPNTNNSYMIKLYIDGKENATKTVTIPITSKLSIGDSTQINVGKNTILNPPIYTKFSFADLQLHQSALDAASVKSLILSSRFTQTKYTPGVTSIVYGNLLKFSTAPDLKRPLPEAEGRNIIQLQFPSKLTGFKFVASAGDTQKYRLFISESRQQVLNPRTRIEVTIPEASAAGGFSFGTGYNNTKDFENEDGTPKYTGAFLAVEMSAASTSVEMSAASAAVEMSTDNSTWATISEYQIFGQMLNAPSMSEYENYINLPVTTQKLGKTGLNANDMIKLDLAQGSDQMVGKVIITNFATNSSYSPQCRMRYRNSLDSAKTSLVAVNGPIRDQFINIPGATTWVLYLDRPVMANYIELTFTNETNGVLDVGSASAVLFGFTPTTRDIANFKLQAGQTSSNARMNLGGTNCPATSEMLNKQVQAQLICEALEYKDKEKNKRLAYERDKLYLQKLKAQESEIRNLEQKITGLIARKNELASKSEGTSIDELEKELKSAEAARKQAEEYMTAKDAARESVRLKVNLDPQFQELLETGSK